MKVSSVFQVRNVVILTESNENNSKTRFLYNNNFMFVGSQVLNQSIKPALVGNHEQDDSGLADMIMGSSGRECNFSCSFKISIKLQILIRVSNFIFVFIMCISKEVLLAL